MPDTLKALQEQVLDAIVKKNALAIQGGGSKQGLGRVSTGQLLSVKDHTGVIDYSPSELVLRVKSGTSIQYINQLLQENQQRLAFEPPEYQGKATIGGTVAANQSGSATPWYGGVKDSLLGLGHINGHGELIFFGGQVMKNVAGFDVTRLQAGAFGTLGVMTEVSLKVLPTFAAEVTLAIPSTLTQALLIMPTFLHRNLPVSGVCYWQQHVYVRFQGLPSAVDAAIHNHLMQYSGHPMNADDAQHLWTSIREQQLLQPQPNSDEVLWRANVAANNQDVLMDEAALVNWAGAQRMLLSTSKTPPISVLPYRGGDRHQEVHGQLAKANRAIQQQLKQAFDPVGIFNIGRLYSWM